MTRPNNAPPGIPRRALEAEIGARDRWVEPRYSGLNLNGFVASQAVNAAGKRLAPRLLAQDRDYGIRI